MSDLISRKALLEDLEWLKSVVNPCSRSEVAEYISRVKKAPAVEAEPVRQSGTWEPHPNHPGFDRCSVCHDCIVANDWIDGRKWKFCPECGSPMDGGKK